MGESRKYSRKATSSRSLEYEAPWEKTFNRVVSPIEEFIHYESSSGVLLMICAAVSFILVNSPASAAFHDVLHSEIGVEVGQWGLKKSVHHWINDGLMTLFFLLAGLEMKREFLVGELSTPRQAMMPVIVAAGGMIVPAFIYYVFNPEGPTLRGWGVPMATDLAFALGVLKLLGNRIPKNLFVFLISFAISDDVGAVLVIALFYTQQISLGYLLFAASSIVFLLALNLMGIRRLLPYTLLGAVVWYATMKSGIHATVAGILIAFTIPARPKFDTVKFSRKVRDLMDEFDSYHTVGRNLLTNQRQRSIVEALSHGVGKVETPLQHLEHSLQFPVSFIVMPIFAFANAGAPLDLSRVGEAMSHPVALGVAVGLVAGKFIGITGSALLTARLGIAPLPQGVTTRHVLGVGMISGIGFTMSIFIAELAFSGVAENLVMAKLGILAASLTAGLGGYITLKTSPAKS